jgi:predicted RNA polymerase sigma factor
VPLDEQDRSLWDRELIAEGVALARVASSTGTAGEYLIQAQIAAPHDTAPRPQDTDWRRIAGLDAVLEQMTSNPMVSLNGAIAVAMFEGPETGLALLQPLEQPLAGHHRLQAIRTRPLG